MYDRVLYLVAFFSKKIDVYKVNCNIYDKELLAIIKTFKEQKPELLSIETKVLSNYKNLKWFITTKQLNR